MNADCQTHLPASAKHSAKYWQPLRESNPSFQIENLAS